MDPVLITSILITGTTSSHKKVNRLNLVGSNLRVLTVSSSLSASFQDHLITLQRLTIQEQQEGWVGDRDEDIGRKIHEIISYLQIDLITTAKIRSVLPWVEYIVYGGTSSGVLPTVVTTL